MHGVRNELSGKCSLCQFSGCCEQTVDKRDLLRPGGVAGAVLLRASGRPCSNDGARLKTEACLHRLHASSSELQDSDRACIRPSPSLRCRLTFFCASFPRKSDGDRHTPSPHLAHSIFGRTPNPGTRVLSALFPPVPSFVAHQRRRSSVHPNIPRVGLVCWFTSEAQGGTRSFKAGNGFRHRVKILHTSRPSTNPAHPGDAFRSTETIRATRQRRARRRPRKEGVAVARNILSFPHHAIVCE